MNYIILTRDRIMNPVNEYVVKPVNNYIVEPVNNYIVEPVITKPITNYVVNPIHTLVHGKDEYAYDFIDTSPERYTTFDSFNSHNTNTGKDEDSLIEESEYEETSYLDHLKEKMYYSSLSLKASVYFFINAWLPNTLKDKGEHLLEREILKKND